MTTDEILLIPGALRHGAAMLRDKGLCGPGNSYSVVMEKAAKAIEALQADAARLDYIASNARCDPKMDGNHVWWPTSFNHRLIGPNLREAIDAAMALDKP